MTFGSAKMLVGVPKEIKDSEYRVGLVPSAVRELTRNGHHVLVEKSAGLGAGLTDADYRSVGAEVVPDADEVYARSELIVKVKEPLAPERKKLRAGQVLFAYLHLAADPQQTAELMASGVIAIAYETVTSPHGTLPLLTPMSEVAGRMAPHVGARRRQPRGPHQRRNGRNRDGHRPQSGRVAPRVDPARRAGPHRVFHQRCDRDAMPPRGSGDRLGSDPRRRGAEIDHRRHGQGDEAGLGHRGHRHRPGRMLRDLAADDALGADLHSLRRRALLRHQYAGLGRPHVDLRPQQRNAALRAGARRQRLSPGAG